MRCLANEHEKEATSSMKSSAICSNSYSDHGDGDGDGDEDGNGDGT